MTPELSTYLYIATTLIAAFVYYLTFRYQAKKIDILEKTIKGQSSIIADFEKFNNLLNVDHFIKNRDLQLETQKIELTRLFEKQSKEIIEKIKTGMNDHYIETNKELFAMVQELVQFPITMIIAQFPDQAQKTERDNFIIKQFPHSASKLIGFCDAVASGQIHRTDPTQ